MKLAIAQIDMRIGDLDAISERLYEQAYLASKQGAAILCAPAPLFAGVDSGTLPLSPAFQHDLLTSLSDLAKRIVELDVAIVVPAPLKVDDQWFLDILLLRGGHVIPMRLARKMSGAPEGSPSWITPTFEHDGLRVMLMTGYERANVSARQGVDLIICFQALPFSLDDGESQGALGYRDSAYPDFIKDQGAWFASVAPLGFYDGSIFIGGSYIADEDGSLRAALPCFEEGLLIQDIQRGRVSDADLFEPPSMSRETLTWESLRIALRGALLTSGKATLVVPLDDTLTATALACLAVDAVGSRRVKGVLVGRNAQLSPRELADEDVRRRRVRKIAASLGIAVVEREVEYGAPDSDLLRSGGASELMAAGVRALCVQLVADELQGLLAIDATKFDYALAAGMGPLCMVGDVAPFGDLFMGDVELMMRSRKAHVPDACAELISSGQRDRQIRTSVARAARGLYRDGDYAERVRALLDGVHELDLEATVAAHVEHDVPVDQIDLSRRNLPVVQMLLLMVRRSEAARRKLPVVAMVSERPLSERRWPETLAWADMGGRDGELLTAGELAAKHLERSKRPASDHMEQMKREVMGLIGGLLGISPDQIEHMAEAAQEGPINIPNASASVPDVMSSSPFFSQN